MFSRLHPLIVHLPIGILLLAALAGWLARSDRWGALRVAAPLLWLLATLSGVVASISGWLLAHQAGAAYDTTLLDRHQWLNIAATALAAGVWALHLLRQGTEHTRAWAGLVPAALLLAGTYTGATLTHGASFLFVGEKTTAQNGPDGFAAADVPTDNPPAPDANALAALRQRGVLVMPVAKESNWLSVNCVNASQFSDADAALLEPLADQIVWLKLGGSAIGDPALTSIGKLTHLTRLHLDGTRVSGPGLVQLSGLSQLRLLNLSGTAVDAPALEPLAALPELQTIFLYHTQVDSAGFANVQRRFSHTLLDTGGYRLPLLEGDTSRLRAKKSY